MDARGFQIANYRIVSRLGAGGMGEVWLADGISGATVVKTILPELAEDHRFVEMFLREARIAAQVQSPHVVAVREVGCSDSTYFLALEYVEGLSLHRLLKLYGGPLPPNLAALVGSQAALGLQHIHDQRSLDDSPLGIVHRDISPGNLLISVDGCVKLTDFGVAMTRDRRLHSATTVGSVRGKIPYMSPEQSLGQRVDHRADVFALGIVLYESLCGELPYPAGLPDIQLLHAVAKGKRRPLEEVDPHVPKGLLAVVDRATRSLHAERYESAGQMHADLLACLGGQEGERRAREELAGLVTDLGPGRSRTPSAVASPPVATRDVPPQAVATPSRAPVVPAELPSAPLPISVALPVSAAPAVEPVAPRRPHPWAVMGVGALSAALVAAIVFAALRPSAPVPLAEPQPIAELPAAPAAAAPVVEPAVERVPDEAQPVDVDAWKSALAREVSGPEWRLGVSWSGEAAPTPLVKPVPVPAPPPARESLVAVRAPAEPRKELLSSTRKMERAPRRSSGGGGGGGAAKLFIATNPPCEVWVEGRSVGVSPVAVGVSPKGNRARLVSRENGIDYDVDLAPGAESLSITVPKGALHIRVDPYSEVTLDGRPLGEGPYEVLPVYAGRHELLIVNRELDIRRKVVTEVEPDKTQVFRLKLP